MGKPLEKCTVVELREKAKKKKIKNYYSKNKAALISALKRNTTKKICGGTNFDNSCTHVEDCYKKKPPYKPGTTCNIIETEQAIYGYDTVDVPSKGACEGERYTNEEWKQSSKSNNLNDIQEEPTYGQRGEGRYLRGDSTIYKIVPPHPHT